MAALDDLTVAVVGLGPMGRGIARVFATAGARVLVADVDEPTTAAGWQRTVDEGGDGVPTRRIEAATSPAAAAGAADLVVEAIVERADAKAALLAQLREGGSDALVVASNTSSLSIGELGQAFGDPGRVIGLHFFNPPERMRLVEVVRGPGTREDVVARAVIWVEAIGKTTVVCRDSPNFVVNRICRPLYYEAQLLATQGVAPVVVDAVAKAALGHPMGPLELLDFTGLHTHLGSSETALRELGDPRYRPIPRTRALVRAGQTGRAVGHGWYDHTRGKPREQRAAVVRERAANGSPVALTGPGRAVLAGRVPAGDVLDGAAVIYSAPVSCTEADVAAVRDLLAFGARVVVDSSHSGWLRALPERASWVRLHVGDAPFAEVVSDGEAGIVPGSAVEDVLGAIGASSVEVPALPGLVGDRLQHALINEAVTVLEEGTAGARDIDTALRLGMNHPAGPLELLEHIGAETVLASLRDMAQAFGDPRYRPAPLLMRRAAGAARRAEAIPRLPA
jgi:3-hydroxybutyryl-CoA dehydrogenase